MPTYSGDESISGEHLKEFLRLLAARLQVVNDDEKILLDETASHKKDLSPDRLERLKSLMQILSMENAYLEHCKERIEAFANPSSPRASLSLQEVDNAFFMYKGASLKDSVNNQSQDKHTTLQRIAGLEGGGAIDLFLKLHSLQTNTVDSYICKHLLEEPQADNSLSANGVVHEENVKALLERKWDGKDTAEKACTNYLHRMLNYQKRKAGSGTDRCVMLDVFEEAKLAIGKCRFETAVKKENPEIGDHVQNAKCNELLQKAAQIEGITIPTIGRT